MQANRNIHLCYEKYPFARYHTPNHPKHSQFAITNIREKTELFLLFNTDDDFSLHNNFENSSSFAKVSVPVHNYNSMSKISCLFEILKK